MTTSLTSMVSRVANHIKMSPYHSNPLPKSYSRRIATSIGCKCPSVMQRAFVNAVVKEEKVGHEQKS